MNKRKKLFLSVLAVLAFVAVITVTFFVSDRKKQFEYSEKMSFSMGTVVSQKLYGDGAAKHIENVNDIINTLDERISWRNEDSLVAMLNEGERVSDAGLAAILLSAQKVSEDSEGAFDVTVGELTCLWSIGEEDERIPSEKEIEKALGNIDYKGLSIKGNEISYEGKGSIDLGAIGKGAACDMVKSYLEASKLKGAVVSVGGSILAWGQNNKAGDEWRIAIRHPRNENELLGVISLKEGFVSTSGDYERYFEKEGKRYHHILDVRNGYPAESDLISVTVVCDSGILSDALSTACFILGKEKSLPLLEKYNASAVFVDSDMNIEVVGDISFEY